MARYKPYSYAQGKFIPIHFAKQILPGTFEYTLNRPEHVSHGITLVKLDGVPVSARSSRFGTPSYFEDPPHFETGANLSASGPEFFPRLILLYQKNHRNSHAFSSDGIYLAWTSQ